LPAGAAKRVETAAPSEVGAVERNLHTMRAGAMTQPRIRVAIWLLAAMALPGLAATGGCAHQDYFPGTTILRTDQNRKIIETIEQYRRRLIERNVEGLLVLASDRYFEDSGTPRSDDDYGYEGLKQVLTTKLQRVKSLRYDIEYRNIKTYGDRAEVEVFLDGSFELAAEYGDRYRRVNDYHRFVLTEHDEKWKFLSGM
jgi:hypothetical protein